MSYRFLSKFMMDSLKKWDNHKCYTRINSGKRNVSGKMKIKNTCPIKIDYKLKLTEKKPRSMVWIWLETLRS